MRVAIHQPQYLSYLGFFHKLAHCDLFIALDIVQFQKNGLQNRNKIKTAQGWQWLTVPVLHNFGQTIRQVQINPDIPWARKHWNALVTSYKQTPYFQTLAPGLQMSYELSGTLLCEVNMQTTAWAMAALGIETPVRRASELDVPGAQTELLVNLCRACGATTYLSGPGGRRYMDLNLFERAGINVEFQEFVSPTYPQVFPGLGFIPDLSVVDALFSCGSAAVREMLG
jgi:hypothetical protein